MGRTFAASVQCRASYRLYNKECKWRFVACSPNYKPKDQAIMQKPLQWRYNGRDGVSNHQPHHSLLNRLFRRRSKKTPKLLVTDLFAGNSPVTGQFPVQMASNAENVPIWWHHKIHMKIRYLKISSVRYIRVIYRLMFTICKIAVQKWLDNRKKGCC